MKRFELHTLRRSTSLAMLLLFFVSSNELLAQNQKFYPSDEYGTFQWAMATIEEGKSMPTLSWYFCDPEQGANGVKYQRIYDASNHTHYIYRAPKTLPYGFRLADKSIYIYDFDSKEERLAFDFTLSVGDRFTTYNGVEWLVDAVKDTLVNLSYKEEGEPSSKRLLKVKSSDGQYTDTWLEDFGSLSNHFMILPLKEKQRTHTLWMQYDYGHNLVRKISDDPLYTHDNGYPEYDYNSRPYPEYVDQPRYFYSTYADGMLQVSIREDFPPNRLYYCFYRVGDELYRAFNWSISPGTVLSLVIRRQYEYCITGLPAPKSGQYKIHYYDTKPSDETVIANTTADSSWSTTSIYDLQGRQLQQKPSKGMYLQGGKKIFIQ